MIPLRDSLRPQKRPYINLLLIFLNLAIFINQLSLTQTELIGLFYRYGIIPERFLLLQGAGWFPLMSSMFFHGGWLHLLGNMLYLWVFGDNVEDRLGHAGYLLFYLAAGVTSGLTHILANPQSAVPTIGASGAVAGILGAYFILFPHARVLTPLPIGFFITTAHLPAVLFLFIWFFLQVFNAMIAGATPEAQMVAWWAHIGGFVLGFLVGAMKRFSKRLLG
jgi:membrane associated rhomboid family serine protease